VKFTTNALLDLARSIGRSYPEPGDTEVDFPGVIQPTTVLEYPLDAAANPDVNAPQNKTFQNTGFNSVIGGGGAANPTIGTLGPGLWEIQSRISVCTNFSRAAAVLFPIDIRLEVPTGGTSFYLLGTYETGTIAEPRTQTLESTTRVLLSSSSHRLRYDIANNAVGEISLFSFSVLCRKLL